MSLFAECPFCHKSVLKLFMAWHVKRHTSQLPDGQMKDHVTVKEVERFQGSLEGVPQVYIHSACGAATGMPEEIVRSYLANPFLYNHKTFCTGCNDYVHMSECNWQETDEQLLTYRRNLMKQQLGDRQLINCTREFIDSAKATRVEQNAPAESMLRLAVRVDENGGRLEDTFTTVYDSESDWSGEYFGMKVLVDFDESANVFYGKTFDCHDGQIVLR